MELLRKLPLAERHVAHGARMVPFAGFEMPMQYEGIKEEHLAVRHRVGLFDVSHMGEVEITGPDAIAAVDGLVTNHVALLEDGQALYTVMCHEHGGIVDDLIVYRLSDEHLLLCVNASNRDKDLAHIKAYITGDVHVEDRGDAYAQLALQGPQAQATLSALTSHDLATLRPFRFASMEVAGVTMLVARTGYTGEDGFELYLPAERAVEVFDALVEAGKPYSMALCGLGCRDTLRLEARLPLYGQDLSDETNPLEAGLGWVVKLDKPGDFVGKAALLQIKADGVTRRLRGLIVQGKGVIRAGCPILEGDLIIGQVTSGTYSISLEQSIGLGYIDVAHLDADEVQIEVRQRHLPATLTTKPFYKR